MYRDSHQEAVYEPGQRQSSPEIAFGDPSLNPPSGDFLIQKIEGDPTIYVAHGKVAVFGAEVGYSVATTEACERGSGITIIGNGFSAFDGTSNGLRNAGASAGETTVAFAPLRHDHANPWRNLLNPQVGQVEAMAAIIEDLQNSDLLNALPHGDKLDLEQITLELHSMAGISGTDFAELNPGVVKKIRFLAAAGFGSPNFAELARNLTPKGLNSLMRDGIPLLAQKDFAPLHKAIIGLAKHHRRPDRTIGEIISCFRADISERVANLGADTLYLDFEEDTVIPPNPDKARAVDGYALMHGVGHCAPQHSPRAVIAEVLELETTKV